jgi:hypothetical protein
VREVVPQGKTGRTGAAPGCRRLAGSGYPAALRAARNAGAGRCGGRRLGQSIGGASGKHVSREGGEVGSDKGG